MQIGSVIRKYRKECGLTQEEMAKRLGVTTPAVNKWENGNTNPDIELLAPIARLLHISLDTLLSFQEKLTDMEIETLIRQMGDKLEKEGFEILPVDKIATDIKIQAGIAGKIEMPDKAYNDDINLGIKVLKQIGDLDIGQSIVIQNGIVMGIECIEGTQKLIERCGQLKYNTGRKPVLVKIKKSKQTRKIDLPAIGEDTITQVKQAGFAGIAIDADNGLIINKESTIQSADRNKIFINGIKV